jgi:hypothetical protein
LTVLTALDPDTPAHVGRPIQKVTGTKPALQTDALAVEEPLAIRLECETGGQRVRRMLSVTMRTPGHDTEVALHAGRLSANDPEAARQVSRPDRQGVV